MQEPQVKRPRGRPRTGRNKHTVSFTLPTEVIEYLDSLPSGEQSRFMAQLVLDHKQEELERERTQS